MKTLELKHLSAYLPYDLDVVCIDKGVTYFGKQISIHSFRIRKNFISNNYQLVYENEGVNIKDIKPLLRPLSQLTQEIEHNGERFVPMIEIVKMIEPYYVKIDESTSDFNVINKCIGKDRVYQLRYKNNYNNQGEISMLNFHENEKCLWHSDRIIPIKCHDKLFEWHFDIYGLIENNLAIEKL